MASQDTAHKCTDRVLLDCGPSHMRNVVAPDSVISSVRREDRRAIDAQTTKPRSFPARAWPEPRDSEPALPEESDACPRQSVPGEDDRGAAGLYWRREP